MNKNIQDVLVIPIGRDFGRSFKSSGENAGGVFNLSSYFYNNQ